jgi:hypothetical protein
MGRKFNRDFTELCDNCVIPFYFFQRLMKCHGLRGNISSGYFAASRPLLDSYVSPCSHLAFICFIWQGMCLFKCKHRDKGTNSDTLENRSGHTIRAREGSSAAYCAGRGTCDRGVEYHTKLVCCRMPAPIAAHRVPNG